MGRWSRRLAGGVLAAVAAATPVSAQSAAPRAAVWVGSGAFLPTDDVYEEAYGQPQWPLIVQGEVRIAGPAGAFAGVRRLARDGETVVEAPTTGVSFPLEFRATSVRFGVSAGVRLDRVEIAAGIGAEYLSGEERWQTADLSSEVDAWGTLVQGSIRIPVWRHLAGLGLFEYSRLRVDPATAGVTAIDVGGVTLGGGVLFWF